jgi:hypothetical protein
MARADNRRLAGIPGAVLGLFVAGVLEALTRRRACRQHDETIVKGRGHHRQDEGVPGRSCLPLRCSQWRPAQPGARHASANSEGGLVV